MLTTVLSFLFVLGVLIFVHEFGHFIVARLHGVRVLRFSLGFDPKLVKFTRGGTEYSIGVIPLGGFVKLAGETVEDNRTGAPDEFLSKSKWVRFQVYIAGPVMNLLLAWVLLAGVYWRDASEPLYWSQPPRVGAILPGSAAERGGVLVGDLITSVNSRPVATWTDLMSAVATKANRETALTVDRNGQVMNISVTPEAMTKFEIGDLGIRSVPGPKILSVSPGSPAELAGMAVGDFVVILNGKQHPYRGEVIEMVRAGRGAPVSLTLERNGQKIPMTVTPASDGLMGVALEEYEIRRFQATLPQAMVLSAKDNWRAAAEIGGLLRDLVRRQASIKVLSGPAGIASMAGTAIRRGWLDFFAFMSMLSLNLGLLNLLPIPVLDGGHIAILAVEGVSRRDLSVRVKERVLLVGAALIILLMVTVIYNDVIRLLR